MKVKIRIVCCLLIASLILPMLAFAEDDNKPKPVDPNIHLLIGIGMTAFGFYQMNEASKTEREYTDTVVEADAKESADTIRNMGILSIGIGLVNLGIYQFKKEQQKLSIIPYNNNTILMAYNISF